MAIRYSRPDPETVSNTGRPMGSEKWARALERRLERRLLVLPIGWPKGKPRGRRKQRAQEDRHEVQGR